MGNMKSKKLSFRTEMTVVVGIEILETNFFHTQTEETGPEVIKLSSCLTQLSIENFPLIYVKMPTIVGILTFISTKIITFQAYLSL